MPTPIHQIQATTITSRSRVPMMGPAALVMAPTQKPKRAYPRLSHPIQHRIESAFYPIKSGKGDGTLRTANETIQTCDWVTIIQTTLPEQRNQQCLPTFRHKKEGPYSCCDRYYEDHGAASEDHRSTTEEMTWWWWCLCSRLCPYFLYPAMLDHCIACINLCGWFFMYIGFGTVSLIIIYLFVSKNRSICFSSDELSIYMLSTYIDSGLCGAPCRPPHA